MEESILNVSKGSVISSCTNQGHRGEEWLLLPSPISIPAESRDNVVLSLLFSSGLARHRVTQHAPRPPTLLSEGSTYPKMQLEN